MVQPVDWMAIAAPLILAGTAVVVLLADAFGSPTAGRARLTARPGAPRELPVAATLTVLGVLGAVVPAALSWGRHRATFCVPHGPCSFVLDRFTLVFWAVVLFGTLVVALIESAVPKSVTPPGEWNFLLLSSATGALTIAASRDLITLVVALEVVSLPAFAMVGLRRGNPGAAEAALKFFLVSVVSTAVMLMGVSLLYGATGSVFLRGIASGLSSGGPLQRVALVGALLTLVGLAFKVAAVPFHMWVPDTYVGAPVAVAAYLSVVSKSAGFVGLMLVLGFGLPQLAGVWAPVLAVLAALTMTVGNVIALRQQHAVRLLAWSSVAQAGYILVPFGAVAAGRAALGAAIGYLAIYAVMNLGAFAVAGVVGSRHPGQRIGDYAGLVREKPLAGWALAFALVALAGLPPGILGLFAKVVVFDAAAGPVTWLVVVMAVNVAIGLVYYVRWLVELFRPSYDAEAYPTPRGTGVAVLLTFVAGIVLSVLPGLVLDPFTTVLAQR
ncbi:MAG TPA: NADH-quinone oxidoreductase subunit N [Nocardioidaceae bacterium]|nr:NADH-quinone oxidoreductase subunit N [Nocardioidaceae bacterium]